MKLVATPLAQVFIEASLVHGCSWKSLQLLTHRLDWFFLGTSRALLRLAPVVKKALEGKIKVYSTEHEFFKHIIQGLKDALTVHNHTLTQMRNLIEYINGVLLVVITGFVFLSSIFYIGTSEQWEEQMKGFWLFAFNRFVISELVALIGCLILALVNFLFVKYFTVRQILKRILSYAVILTLLAFLFTIVAFCLVL